MAHVVVPDVRSFDRRQWHRVKLSVPVQFGKGAASEGQGVCPHTGGTIDLSNGGLYLSTGAGERFVPGEILTVSVEIPWEARGTFPFSRIVGSCRVVRVEEGFEAHGQQTGLALAFCEDRITLLGAIVTP